MCYHSGPEGTWEQCQWRGATHSPKLQHYWNLTIRFFSVISSTLMVGGGSYPFAEVQSMYSTAPANWAIVVLIKNLTQHTSSSLLFWSQPSLNKHPHLCCFDPNPLSTSILIFVLIKTLFQQASSSLLFWSKPSLNKHPHLCCVITTLSQMMYSHYSKILFQQTSPSLLFWCQRWLILKTYQSILVYFMFGG